MGQSEETLKKTEKLGHPWCIRKAYIMLGSSVVLSQRISTVVRRENNNNLVTVSFGSKNKSLVTG